VFVAAVRADLLLPGQVRSLKGRRGIVNPLIAALRRSFEVSAADVSDPVLPGRVQLGISAVSGSPGHAQGVLDGVERWLSERPEVDLLSVQRRVFGIDD
jgi:uncharacterized protein YlxP (DUF503 family)